MEQDLLHGLSDSKSTSGSRQAGRTSLSVPDVAECSVHGLGLRAMIAEDAPPG
jgi:hypothetical protein